MNLSRLIETAAITVPLSMRLQVASTIEIINPVRAKISFPWEQPTKRLLGTYYLGGFVYRHGDLGYTYAYSFSEKICHVGLIDRANFERLKRDSTTRDIIFYFVTIEGIKKGLGMRGDRLSVQFTRGDLQ